jgi:hypothetical protein
VVVVANPIEERDRGLRNSCAARIAARESGIAAGLG